MEETLFEKFAHLLVFLAICGLIVWVGWNEPLRSRFMSQSEIMASEHPVKPAPTPSWVENRYRGSRLDEPAQPATTGGGGNRSRGFYGR